MLRVVVMLPGMIIYSVLLKIGNVMANIVDSDQMLGSVVSSLDLGFSGSPFCGC